MQLAIRSTSCNSRAARRFIAEEVSPVKRSAVLFGVALIALGVPRLGGFVANQFDFAGLDPDGAFAWISVHHVVQALIVLISMLVIARGRGIDFGFGWGDSRTGLRFVRVFALILLAYTVVSMAIVLVAGTFRTFPYPLTALNVSGQIAFQLLLSGPSEELIFRAFGITMLAFAFKGALFNRTVSTANIIAAVIFSLAHVGVSLSPFALSYDPFQLVYAGALGIVYGMCYEKSGSVYYPMMLHSISNVVAVAVSAVAAAIIG